MSLVTVLMGIPLKGTRISRTLDRAGIEASIILDATVKESFSAPSEVTQHPVEEGPDISDHIILRPQKLTIEGIITETPFSLRSQAAGIASTVASQIGMGLGKAAGNNSSYRNVLGGPGNGGAIGGAALTAVAAKSLAGVLSPSSVTGKRLSEDDANEIIDEDTGLRRSDVKLPTDNVRLRDAVDEFMLIRASRAPVNIITGLRKYQNFVMTGFDVTRETVIGKTLRVVLEFQEVQFAVIGAEIAFTPAVKKALPKTEQGRKSPESVTGDKEKNGSILYENFGGRFE
jgi:hypothetical protein